MFVGALDLIFAIIVIILGCKGIIKNDITERKEQADVINAKRQQIQSEIDTRKGAEDHNSLLADNQVGYSINNNE